MGNSIGAAEHWGSIETIHAAARPGNNSSLLDIRQPELHRLEFGRLYQVLRPRDEIVLELLLHGANPAL